MLFFVFVFVLSLVVNVGLAYALRIFIKRLIEFDDLYEFLIDDIEANLKQFERIRKSNLLSDDETVRVAHKNMMVMAARLDEYINRMEETSKKKLRKVTVPMAPINVTEEAEKIANV